MVATRADLMRGKGWGEGGVGGRARDNGMGRLMTRCVADADAEAKPQRRQGGLIAEVDGADSRRRAVDEG